MHHQVLDLGVGEASCEQSRRDHLQGATSGLAHLVLLSELYLTSSSCCCRPELDCQNQAREHSGTGLGECPLFAGPLGPHPLAPQGSGFWLHPILSQAPAQPTSPQTSRSPSSSSCHFILRVVGDGTWSESGPDSSSLPTNKRVAFIAPPFTHRMHTKSLKPKP